MRRRTPIFVTSWLHALHFQAVRISGIGIRSILLSECKLKLTSDEETLVMYKSQSKIPKQVVETVKTLQKGEKEADKHLGMQLRVAIPRSAMAKFT